MGTILVLLLFFHRITVLARGHTAGAYCLVVHPIIIVLHGDGGCVAAGDLPIVSLVLNIGYCVLSRSWLLLPIQYSFVINNLFVELKFVLHAFVLEGFLKILKFRRSTWIHEL